MGKMPVVNERLKTFEVSRVSLSSLATEQSDDNFHPLNIATVSVNYLRGHRGGDLGREVGGVLGREDRTDAVSTAFPDEAWHVVRGENPVSLVEDKELPDGAGMWLGIVVRMCGQNDQLGERILDLVAWDFAQVEDCGPVHKAMEGAAPELFLEESKREQWVEAVIG